MKHSKTASRRNSLWWQWLGSFALVALCLLGGAMSSDRAPYPGGGDGSESSDEGKIRLLLAMVWEGRDLAPHNLTALTEFRRDYPDLSVVHLISPAYFTKPKANAAQIVAAIRSQMQPQDQAALLLGPWKSLAHAAQVIYRPAPTFWSQEAVPGDCQVDCGGDVPLNIYPDADVEKLLTKSLKLFDSHGLGRPIGLAVQGWMASQAVHEAATKAGIQYDLSAVAPDLLVRRLRHFPLYAWAKALWSEITPHSQPYVIDTASGPLVEIPLSLASVDYLTRKEIDSLFKEYVGIWRENPRRDLIFPLVLTQETAMHAVPLMKSSLQGIFAAAAVSHVPLAAMRLPDEGAMVWDEKLNRPVEKVPPPPSTQPSESKVETPVAH
ncbi:MAG: hypothetical protein FJ146_11430 [Deltaproteobacteria bacterium]|nr:hypothetical protein [Deltaproteobacteria bacterium]